MARKKTIARDVILDAAESVLLEQGASHFTLDTVAEQAHISKGGLTYSFSSKEELLSALLEREAARLRQGIEERCPQHTAAPYPELASLFHLILQTSEPDRDRAKVAKIIAALMHSPASLEPSRIFLEWISSTFPSGSDADRKARQAFFAVQGAFLLNGLGLLPISLETRNAVLSEALVSLSAPPSKA